MSERLDHDWFPTSLPANVSLGQRNWLYSSFAFVHYQSRRPYGLRTGNDTGLYNGTFFDLGPDGEVSIGEYCTVVGAVFSTNLRIEIDDYSFLAHEVVLADSFGAAPPPQRILDFEPASHAVTVPDDLNSTAAGPETSISIGRNAWIAARAILLRGARIGEGSIVGAAAVVDFEVPPFSLVAGNPARIIRSLK